LMPTSLELLTRTTFPIFLSLCGNVYCIYWLSRPRWSSG
jgi:hypothetical protein